jgi:ribose transport system substrate-binding protein
MRKQALWTAVLAAAAFAAVYTISTYRLFGPAPQKEKTVVVMLKSSDIRSDFWQTISAGAKAAAKESGIKLVLRGPLSDADVKAQIDLLDAATREKPQAIVLAPVDSNLLAPAAAKVRAAGIPLVVMDTPLSGSQAQTSVTSNNTDAGKQAGQALTGKTKSRPVFAVISDFRDSPLTTARTNGVLEALTPDSSTNYGTYYADESEDKAYRLAQALIVAHEDLNGLITLTEKATLGAAKAIKEAKLGDSVSLVGFDSSIYEIQLLEEGLLDATVVEKPFNMGYLGVQNAVKLMAGRPPAGTIYIDSSVVTRETMYNPENQKLLFPLLE